MAFSIRKIISNMNYFSKSGDGNSLENSVQDVIDTENSSVDYFNTISASENVEFGRPEPDSTTKCAKSLILPSEAKSYAIKKGSLSDTDILEATDLDRKKYRKLKLDIKRASESTDTLNTTDSPKNVENTPKHKHTESKNIDLFKFINLNESFQIADNISDNSSDTNEHLDIDMLSDNSDTSSDTDEDTNIKMCRKVIPEPILESVPSATPESFADVIIDKNEEERLAQLLEYQNKIGKLENIVKNLFTEFQFHIEVSKIFNCKLNAGVNNGLTDNHGLSNGLLDNVNPSSETPRTISPSWNVIEEGKITKNKFKAQLLNIRNTIDMFISRYLQEKPKLQKSSTFELHKGQRSHKKAQVSNKKKIKHYDYPDLRDAMVNLFSDTSSEESKCQCCCHNDTESIKSDKEENHSISSSIGNFTLDSTTLTAFSESLDYIISYNSFQDTSLYNTVIQKPAIERITFYIQVHSIQLTSETNETKNTITFYCPACQAYENEENNLLKHILNQTHCEKIHFLYKTAYVKKCISLGKEIMPSTVLNPMTMYRDLNKIVCFGDATYACSLCFELDIVGESVLMAHCMDEEHCNRREMLQEIFD